MKIWYCGTSVGLSLSARRAWIEIDAIAVQAANSSVVALRKESVDRNIIRIAPINSVSSVALRKESVDRNIDSNCNFSQKRQSLSARRAWIEMVYLALIRYLINSRSPQGERG